MLRIKGGRVYDPVNGVNGEIKDICIHEGKIVSHGKEGEVLDASGLVVMPGGVEIHTHIAGPKVNTGRVLCPEDHRGDPVKATGLTRSGVGCTVPSTFVTGYRYTQLGYTTVVEAALPPLEARHVHEELADTPLVDKAALALMGNNHFVLNLAREGQKERLKDYVVWLLQASGAYGIKVVNAGGVANWKKGGNVRDLEDQVTGYGITPREIIDTLLEVNEGLGLPHPLHLHCNNLGHKNSKETALATMKLAAGRRLHITHLQFSSYQAKEGVPFVSGTEELAAFINDNPHVTIDVGQVVFGPATTMTADGPLQYKLHRVTGEKWANKDIEGETGSGVVPLTYSKNTYVGAAQWLIGLELFLQVTNPWQVFLTTDHPNAGPFTGYPRIIKLLMNRDYREEVAAGLNKKALAATGLLGLKREYTLEEIAIVTRAGPARTLGLVNKGHLGPGADADVAVYRPQADWEKMFAQPVYVIKGGRLVAKEGEILEDFPGKTLLVKLPDRAPVAPWLLPEFSQLYSISLENYPVEKERLNPREVVSCR